MKRRIGVRSLTTPGVVYIVTSENGVSTECTCQGFSKNLYCKHLEIGDLMDSYMVSKSRVIESLGISGSLFRQRFASTVKKYKGEKSEKPVVDAIERIILLGNEIACKQVTLNNLFDTSEEEDQEHFYP